MWLSASDGALTALVVVGALAALALTLNLWPRAALVVCALAFLSFVAAGQAFAYYQSDGMLMEASLLGFFYAPRGLRPRLGGASPPSRASLWLMRWEWFRIYFESGIVKLSSGESQWRDLTRHGQVLRERPPADVDRLVRAGASAARLPLSASR